MDDYVGADNPVRLIDAFGDGLDLTVAGFAHIGSEPTGRPGYASGDLLKLRICGYLNRVRSSRWLEVETHRTSNEEIAFPRSPPARRMVTHCLRRSRLWIKSL